MGGPMMGIAVADTNAVVTKGCNCVLALPADATADAQRTEMPCIRCGECANVCPAKLLPQQLLWEIRAGNYEAAEADYHLDACIECGCCAVACPSHIPLVDYYRHAKAEVRHLAVEQQKAREAKERYERRNARIEAQQRAREERLKRRKQRLQKETPESENAAKATPQSVADAIARAKAKKRNPDP